MKLWFIDYEASSLSDRSYPIEVGVARVDLATRQLVESHGWLIKPYESWREWNPESEKIHGISRQDLEAGQTPMLVADLLNMVLGSPYDDIPTVYCDSPAFDGQWNRTLFGVTPFRVQYHLDGVWTLIHSLLAQHASDEAAYVLRPQISAILARPNPHRAKDDAELLASSFLEIYELILAAAEQS